VGHLAPTHPPLGILCHYVFLIEGVKGHSQKKLCAKILALEGLSAILLLLRQKKSIFYCFPSVKKENEHRHLKSVLFDES